MSDDGIPPVVGLDPNFTSEPPMPVMTELGRLTWWAILLEGLVDSMCHAIFPHHPIDDDRPVGNRINDALKYLRGWPTSTVQRQADEWLTRAMAALDGRNAVMHSMVEWVFGDDEVGAPHSVLLLMAEHLRGQPESINLGQFPRKTKVYASVPLTTESLGATCQQLADATQGWKPIFLDVGNERVANVMRERPESER